MGVPARAKQPPNRKDSGGEGKNGDGGGGVAEKRPRWRIFPTDALGTLGPIRLFFGQDCAANTQSEN